MSDRQLDEHLEALRAEIGDLDAADAAARTKLLALAHEIEMKLEGSGSVDEGGGLTDDLRDAIREYEVEHPRATGVLNQILMTLSNMGI